MAKKNVTPDSKKGGWIKKFGISTIRWINRRVTCHWWLLLFF